jgi:hypothetical protein
MNSYELSTNWFEFSFQNPDKIKPLHTALYFYTIEKCNKMGWKQKFGIPTDQAMEAIGVKNYKTYIKGLLDLVDFGFIKIHQRSKNAYTANIIEVVKNTKVTTNAHTKAGQMHTPKQVQSTVSINKQLNLETIKLIEANASLIEENLEEWINNSKKSVSSRPKTVKEVEDYMTEIGYPNPLFESQQFFDHYEANGWMRGRNGKNKIKDWKAVVRTWHRRKEKDDKVVRNEYGSAVGQKGDREALAKYMGITVEELDKIKPIY